MREDCEAHDVLVWPKSGNSPVIIVGGEALRLPALLRSGGDAVIGRETDGVSASSARMNERRTMATERSRGRR